MTDIHGKEKHIETLSKCTRLFSNYKKTKFTFTFVQVYPDHILFNYIQTDIR